MKDLAMDTFDTSAHGQGDWSHHNAIFIGMGEVNLEAIETQLDARESSMQSVRSHISHLSAHGCEKLPK